LVKDISEEVAGSSFRIEVRIETAAFSEMLINAYETTRSHNPEHVWTGFIWLRIRTSGRLL
jgi:hypothetical protein